MLKLFRKIRQQFLEKGQTKNYLLYAIGEIFLVVIGILIALQINNWNQDKQDRENEAYVLTEIVNNLKEDAAQINDILQARQQAKKSINRMLRHLREPIVPADTMSIDITYFLKFERYYPIYIAYEMMKSTGLKVANRKLRTAIARYYDFEQNKVASSIQDIERVFLTIMEGKNAIKGNFANVSGTQSNRTRVKQTEGIQLIDANDPVFKKELFEEVVAFQGNNNGTLDKLLLFYQLNQELTALIEKELNTSRLRNYDGG